ncbi:MAG: rhodanese-like domain-containing protein [Anaerolineales bacterium]|nr:rhodanese-like domain-containing protein [Anaerolineales bacterium]MCL4259624.1 rhodanese-like domain-containing protein [Anaerolineales bacterium]
MSRTRFFLAFSALALAALACNALTSSAPTQNAPTDGLPRTEDDVPRIDVDAAKEALDSGAAILVDVRSKVAYAESHIPGALSIPLDVFEINVNDSNLDKAQWIITYCT